MSGATTSTAAQRIVADGAEITFTDGSTARLRFGMRGILAVEEEFGGVSQLLDTLNAPSAYGKLYTHVVQGVRCGLAGQDRTYLQHAPDGRSAEQRVVPYTVEVLEELLDPSLLNDYVRALGKAMDEALPAPTSTAAGNGQGNDGAHDGPPSTTSAPSSSDAPTASSGG